MKHWYTFLKNSRRVTTRRGRPQMAGSQGSRKNKIIVKNTNGWDFKASLPSELWTTYICFICTLSINLLFYLFFHMFREFEHREDFRYAEGKSKFSEHVLNEGDEMKTIEETMSIIHLENDHRKINTLLVFRSLQVCLFFYGHFQGVLWT